MEDLPFKIELDGEGNLVMSAINVLHGGLQGEVGCRLMELLPDGVGACEIGVRTRDNVKVADFVWFTREHWEAVKEAACCDTAPAICVEVACGGDPVRSFERKKPLYFDAGAKEVWFCDLSGNVTFHTPEGQAATSPLCPDFPVSMQAWLTPPPRRSPDGRAGSARGR